jgi:hypothetical protein
MINMSVFGVGTLTGTLAGTARDLRVLAAWPSHTAHAAKAHAPSASGAQACTAEQRKRRTAAATDASVDGGTT